MLQSATAARIRAWSEFLADEGLELWRDVRPGAASAVPVPAPAAPASLDDPAEAPVAAVRELLDAVRADLGDCRRCKLAAGRQRLVFGEGNPEARLMFVGEGPGADEDRSGRPFVGAAGQLLDRMIEAMGLQRDDVYIANIVKCRPPGNRDPEADEAATCRPFLERQIRSVQPDVLVTLGRPAARWLLDYEGPVSKIRGVWQSWEEIPVMPTFHPAFLLRDASHKREAWADLQAVMARLGLGGAGR